MRHLYMPHYLRSFNLVVVLFLSVCRPSNAQDAPSPWIEKVGSGQYFAVIVSDLEHSEEWYSSVLGLSTIDRLQAEDDSYRIVVLQNDRFIVELLQLADAVDVERAMTFFKVGFDVPDAEELADRVEERTGVRPRVLTFERQGVRLIQIRDPDGNIIQPMERLRPTNERP